MARKVCRTLLSAIDRRRCAFEVIIVRGWTDKLWIGGNVVVFGRDINAERSKERASSVVEDVVLECRLVCLAGRFVPGAVDGRIGGRAADDVVDDDSARAAVTVGIGVGVNLRDGDALCVASEYVRNVVHYSVIGDEDGRIASREACIHEANCATAVGGIVIDQILDEGGTSTVGRGKCATGVGRGVVADGVVHDQHVLRGP